MLPGKITWMWEISVLMGTDYNFVHRQKHINILKYQNVQSICGGFKEATFVYIFLTEM